MADLNTRLEVTKLAHELDVDEAALAFLADLAPEELLDFRELVSDSRFRRHEDRFKRLAALIKLLPMTLTAKIAELAVGPMVSARIAAVMDPHDAINLAKMVKPEYLSEIAVHLDPKRVSPIIGALDRALIVDVGKRVLARKEYVVLGRFVSTVAPEAAVAVVEDSDSLGLLWVALYCEDRHALDAIVSLLDEQTLVGVLRAVGEHELYDEGITLLNAVSFDNRARLVALLGEVDHEDRVALLDAVVRHDAWGGILPVLGHLDDTLLRSLVNGPATLDVAVIDRVLVHAREQDVAAVLVRLILNVDAEHVEIIEQSTELRNPETQRWLLETSGVAEKLVRALLTGLGIPA